LKFQNAYKNTEGSEYFIKPGQTNACAMPVEL